MPIDAELLDVAHRLLRKNRDSTWDSRGTVAKKLSQEVLCAGTGKSPVNQKDDPTVPLSRTLGHGTVGHPEETGTARGTVAGQWYQNTQEALRLRCPEFVETERWQQTVRDAECFLSAWGAKAYALGWSARELFGLHEVPSQPRPFYNRLARYDETGLLWLLQGRPVIALTADDAAIQCSNSVVVYRKYRKPAFGPLGDSLDDMGPAA
jgi:hypothetical protein